MMTLLSLALSLVILALILWIVATALEMVIAAIGFPPQLKPIVLALAGLLALKKLSGGSRFHW